VETSTTAAHHREDVQRLVVFLGGFDPRGARHYHQLMRAEAAHQSQVSGAAYMVGPRSRWHVSEPAGLPHAMWTVSADVDADGARACDYLFIEWSDLVRQHWPPRTWAVMRDGWATYKAVWKNKGVLPPVHRETPYVLWTLAYPLVYALFFLLMGAVALLVAMVYRSDMSGVFLGAVAAVLVCFTGYKLDKLLHVSWLLRILNFAHHTAHQPVEDLKERWNASANLAAQQMQQGRYREVVVVGFSVGSAMAVPFVHALRAALQRNPDGPQRVDLVTLGNCIPLFTLMPQSTQVLHRELLALAQDPDLYWVDISSPSDSMSFGMCNLLQISLPLLSEKEQMNCMNPRHMCSPRFHKLFSSSTYRWIKRNKMRMHFQYLMASELAGAYDYFALLTHKGQLMDFIYKRLVR
jgi:hypothetical protein